MANPTATAVMPQLCRMLESAAARQRGDAELLEQFLQQGDEAAFAALVRRHGALVLGLCRRVVGDAHEAEDAFQATFLLLAQKAGTLRRRDSVCSWLYGVAWRVARKARLRAARSRRLDMRGVPMRQGDPLDDVTWRDLRRLLDEELERLPEKHRAPLLLCYLEGLTQDEAARRLHWPRGTFKRRLERARELLHGRLTRRGVTLSAALLTVTLAQQAKAAAPVPLVQATTQAAAQVAAGQAMSSVVSGSVEGLLEGALNDMAFSKGRIFLVVLVSLGLLGTGTGLVVHQGRAEKPAAAKPAEAKPAEAVRTDGQGDPLPPDAIARLGSVRLRHGANVTAVAFAPDGKVIASSGLDWVVRVWDPTSGKEIRQLRGHGGWVHGIAFAPDGKTLASVGDQRSQALILWDVATGKKLHQCNGHKGSVLAVAYAPDGKLVASGGEDQTVRLWNPATGALVGKPLGLAGQAHAVAFSPDSKLLAAAGTDRAITLFEVATGKEVAKIENRPDTVSALTFSPDGKLLASGSVGEIGLWDAATGKEVRRLDGHKGANRALAFTADSKALIAGNELGGIRTIEVATGKELRQYSAHANGLRCLALSPDGKVIASGGIGNHVHLADATTGKPQLPLEGHVHQLRALAYAPDGKRIASGSMDGMIVLWDPATRKAVRRLEGHTGNITALTFTIDGKTLVSGSQDGTIRLWDPGTGKERLNFPAHPGGTTSVDVSEDGKTLVSGGLDRIVRLWEADTGKMIRMWEGTGVVEKVAYSPDGNSVAAIGYNQTLFVWEAASGKALWQHKDEKLRPLASIAFAPDGRTLALASKTGPIQLWETRTGKLRHEFKTLAETVLCLSFSPDGRLLANGVGGGIVRIRDTATGEEAPSLKRHEGWVRAVAFAPDGKTIASGSEDNTVLLWDVARLGRPAVVELTPKSVEANWGDLAEVQDSAKVQRAMATLLSAPGQTVPWLQKQLQPGKPADPEQQKRIAELLKQLDSDQFTERENATNELAKIGDPAVPQVQKLLQNPPSAEVKLRLERILEMTGGSGMTPDQLRMLRAMELLERLGTPEARAVVETLAKGPAGASLTEEAMKVKKRLDRRARE